MPQRNWNLSVDKRVVRLLSASTYEEFPGSLREMVSNSYDADATQTDIIIDLNKDFLQISDNGNGMTPNEFDFFLRIAGKHRESLNSPFNRKRIGQFGIGFLSIFPFGQKIQIKSTKRGSDISFTAMIPAYLYFKDDSDGIDIEEIPVTGVTSSDPRFISEHGTEITITGLTYLIERYFKKPENIRGNSVQNYDPMKRLKWYLEENLPLDYHEDSIYKEAFSNLGPVGLSVNFNGQKIYRNSPGKYILEDDKWEEDGFKCQYVISTNWASILPNENRYFKQRLNNVGVGNRTTFNIGLFGKTYSRLHWLSGEIRILEGFDHLITIDRSRFIEGPEYDKYKNFFQSKLRRYANYVERVSHAGRDISRQLSNSKVAEVGAKKEIIEEKIEVLKDLGFHVETVLPNDDHHDISEISSSSKRSTDPIIFDYEKKEIKIVKNEGFYDDFFEINNKRYEVQYFSNKRNPNLAIRKVENNILQVNSEYYLFKSRRYGELIKKILLFMFVLEEEESGDTKIFTKLTSMIAEELDI